jgi:hypothetical protein
MITEINCYLIDISLVGVHAIQYLNGIFSSGRKTSDSGEERGILYLEALVKEHMYS